MSGSEPDHSLTVGIGAIPIGVEKWESLFSEEYCLISPAPSPIPEATSVRLELGGSYQPPLLGLRIGG